MNRQKKMAKEAVKNLRYGDNDYFFIIDMKGYMLAHPISPEEENTDWTTVEDPNGKRFILDFVNLCKKEGEGFVDYVWTKPGISKPAPKISYVKLFPEWDWGVATGIYVDDVERELTQLFMVVFGVAIVIIVGSLFFSFFMARSISIPILSTASNLDQSVSQVASASQDNNLPTNYRYCTSIPIRL